MIISEPFRDVVFDTETTGSGRDDRIIQIGLVELIDMKPTGRKFESLCNPEGREIHWGAQRVHGISARDLVGQPLFRDIYPEILEFIGDSMLLAHNAAFDKRMLNSELGHAGQAPLPDHRFFCTLNAAKKSIGGKCGMDTLIDRYMPERKRGKHSALMDAEILAELLPMIMNGQSLPRRRPKPTSRPSTLMERPDARPRLVDDAAVKAAIMAAKTAEDALALKTGGLDLFSSLNEKQLGKVIHQNGGDLAEIEGLLIGLPQRRRVTALRWICRGLSPELAAGREILASERYDQAREESPAP